MDKKTILKIAAVIFSISFILNFFPPGSIPIFAPANPLSGENVSGEVYFESSVISYDPVVLIENNLTENLSYVSSVESFESGVILRLLPGVDVEDVRADLYSKGYSPQVVANFILPNYVNQRFGTNELNVSTLLLQRNGFANLKLVLPYILPKDQRFILRGQGLSNNKYLIALTNISLNEEIVNRSTSIEILSLENAEYVYQIPWESRPEFNQSLVVLFNPPLSAEELLSKNYDYVEYLTADYAIVSITNKSRILGDFPNAQFPVYALESNTSLDLPFNYTVQYRYRVSAEGLESIILSEDVLNGTYLGMVELVVINDLPVSIISISLPDSG